MVSKDYSEFGADPRDNPEDYAEDLEEFMRKTVKEIEKELQIEEEAVEIDKEILQDIEGALRIYAEYKSDLEAFLIFLNKEADEEGQEYTPEMFMKFQRKVMNGEIKNVRNPEELPNRLRTMHEVLTEAHEALEKKHEDLKKVLKEDKDVEKEMEVIDTAVGHMNELAEQFERFDSQVGS